MMSEAVMVAPRRRVVRAADAAGVRPRSVDERMASLVHLLERWAIWSESFKVRLGYPSNSAGISSGEGFGSRGDSQHEQEQVRVCTLVDVAVDELAPAQRAAVNRRYGLAAGGVVRFPRDNYAELLSVAHDMLLVSLPKKGVDI